MTQPMPSIEEWEVLDLLTSLVDKSLVVYEEDEQGVGRYRLLETVRQYALDKLIEQHRGEDVRGRHRDYFLNVAEVEGAKLVGPEQKVACDRLEEEYDNLRAALDWCLTDESETRRQSSAETALRLCYALQRFWWVRAYVSEAANYCQAALSHPCAQTRTMLRVRALHSAALFAEGLGEVATTRLLLEEGLSIAEELHDSQSIAALLSTRGTVAFSQGDFTLARSDLERVVHIENDLQIHMFEPIALAIIGFSFMIQGELAAADSHFQKACHVARTQAHLEGEASGQIGRGYIALLQGECSVSCTEMEQALATLRAGGYYTYQSLALRGLATARMIQGDNDTARILMEQAVELNRRNGFMAEDTRNAIILAWIEVRRGEIDQAREWLERAMPDMQRYGRKWDTAQSLEIWGVLNIQLGQWKRATRLMAAAATLRTLIGAPVLLERYLGYDDYMATLKEALSEAEFTAAWHEGHGMTMQQAIEYALAEGEAP